MVVIKIEMIQCDYCDTKVEPDKAAEKWRAICLPSRTIDICPDCEYNIIIKAVVVKERQGK